MKISINIEEGNYNGSTEEGLFSGEGIFTDHEGTTYMGTWFMGHAIGYGTIRWPHSHSLNPTDRKGSNSKRFVTGVLQGQTSKLQKSLVPHHSARKSIFLEELGLPKMYEGRVYKNIANGEGALEFTTGAKVLGQFEDGVLNGLCKVNWPNGDYAEGTYRAGLPVNTFQYYYAKDHTLELISVSNWRSEGMHGVIATVKVNSPRVVTKLHIKHPSHHAMNISIVECLLSQLDDLQPASVRQTKRSGIIARQTLFKPKNQTANSRYKLKSKPTK